MGLPRSRLRGRGVVCAVLLAVVVPMTTAGCFGRFELTRKLYRFNRDISSDRWVRWGTFLVMAIFPVYLAGGIIDVILSNSIEFWGGRSPFAGGEGETRFLAGPHGEQVRITRVSEHVLAIDVTDASGTRSFRIVREDESLAAFDADGALLARVGDRGGRAAVLEGGPR